MYLKNINNPKALFRVFLLVVFVLLVVLLYFINSSNTFQARLKSEVQNSKSLSKQLVEYQQDYRSPKPTPTKLDNDSESSLPIFLSKIYPTLPNFQKLVKKQNIKRVFYVPIANKTNGKGANSVWIVEEEKNDETNDELGNISYSYYYVNPQVQKIFLQPMSSNADINGKGCRLEDYKAVGNGQDGYLILSSNCWYGGNSISVYEINSGEKVILKSNIQENDIKYPIISTTGNIIGNVIGLFGINNPILFVGINNEGLNPSEIYVFDIQNRKVIQHFQLN
ncbi:MAG: hypothetical protein NTV98_03150 [Candidatus Roizmanbacteria bacterium]|nr:hypothetical protein [Candidatus Roizmanbacteria bacterium]